MAASKEREGRNSPILVEMSPELAAFVIENCDSNIGFSLGFLQGMSRDNAEKMVALIENFKALKLATEKAVKGEV